jgi:hypothetical protein
LPPDFVATMTGEAMMAKKQTAIVIVTSEWFYTQGVRRFLGGAHTQPRDNSSHFITAPLVDDRHPRGVVLGDVTTTAVRRRDGKDFTVDFLIPWEHVLGLGVVEESGKKPVGFTAGDGAIVVGPSAQE